MLAICNGSDIVYNIAAVKISDLHIISHSRAPSACMTRKTIGKMENTSRRKQPPPLALRISTKIATKGIVGHTISRDMN